MGGKAVVQDRIRRLRHLLELHTGTAPRHEIADQGVLLDLEEGGLDCRHGRRIALHDLNDELNSTRC
jgi:hypothetical protein